jgi:hypothetical protein
VPEILGDFTAEEMEFEEWLSTMPAKRRPALARALETLRRRGLRRGDAKFTAFVKAEFLPDFEQVGVGLERLEGMIDRLIQGPADITHCVAGPILKPLLSRLKELWGPETPLFYGSAGPEKLHQFLQRLVDGEGTYFWSDFSMFDSTHSAESWEFMEWLYGDHGVNFKRVLEYWRQPKGFIGAFKYKGPVMNASGRDDTALANAVLNGFATTLSCTAAYLGVPLMSLSIAQVRAVRASMLLSVCGDDSLGKLPVMSSRQRVLFAEAFAKNIRMFGFEAKFGCSQHLTDAVYLGMRPYPTRVGWFWGKTIGRATYKMGFVMDPEGRDLMAHITGVADMHVICSSHVPILGDLAAAIVRLRDGAKRTPVRLDPNKPWEWTFKSGVQYDELTLQAVADLYSRNSGTPVSVNDMHGLIEVIRSLDRLPAVIDHWLWQLIIATDDL